MELKCKSCGKIFAVKNVRGRTQEYCSRECYPKRRYSYTRKTCDKVCEWCQKPFQTKCKKTRFCSLSCGTTYGNVVTQGKKASRRQCLTCRRWYNGKKDHGEFCCSKKCWAIYYKAKTAERDQARGMADAFVMWANSWRECRQCARLFTHRWASFCSKDCSRTYTLAKSAELRHANPIPLDCVICGNPFFVYTYKPETDRRKYCSKRCSRYAHKKQQWRYLLLAEYGLTANDIYKRDGWMCGICGKPVTAAYPDMMCASLDHIVPKSFGGPHSPANLRLVHWLCNVLRSNKIDADCIAKAKELGIDLDARDRR